MKKLTLMSILALECLIVSCKKDSNEIKPVSSSPNPQASTLEATDTCQTVITDFYAGQNTLVGSVSVSNDEENLYVTFTTESGWIMGKTHLYVGSLQGMPQTPNGNPKVGLFPYQTTYNPMVNSHTYTIPLSQIKSDNNCVIIAAHAEVSLIGPDGNIKDSQTAWGAGTQFNESASWASYFDYCICNGSSGGGSTGGGMEG